MEFSSGGTSSSVTSRRRGIPTPLLEISGAAATQEIETTGKDRFASRNAGTNEEQWTSREALAPIQSRRDVLRRRLKHAARSADRMVSSQNNGDLMDLSLAGFELVATLKDLWDLREDRESEWREIVNLIQGTLTKREFELFTEKQVKAVQECVQVLSLPHVDVTNLEEVVIAFQRAGLDPFGPISDINNKCE